PAYTNVAYDRSAIQLVPDEATYGRALRFGTLAAQLNEDGALDLYSRYLYCAARATAIDDGLNWFGYLDSYIPPWSFDHLYECARDMCNRALEMEGKVFTLLQALEAAERESFAAANAEVMAEHQL